MGAAPLPRAHTHTLRDISPPWPRGEMPATLSSLQVPSLWALGVRTCCPRSGASLRRLPSEDDLHLLIPREAGEGPNGPQCSAGEALSALCPTPLPAGVGQRAVASELEPKGKATGGQDRPGGFLWRPEATPLGTL